MGVIELHTHIDTLQVKFYQFTYEFRYGMKWTQFWLILFDMIKTGRNESKRFK